MPALGGLNGEAKWEDKIMELMDAVDNYIPIPQRSTRLCRLGITGMPSASIVRRDAHIAPYNA